MNSKYTDTIIKLNKLTKDGDIVWSEARFEPSSISGTERLVGNSFTTQVKDKKFRLYKFEERHYTDYDEYTYVPSYRLEFIDDRGKPGWVFPDNHAIEDLYDTVLFKTSGTDEFIDDFLTD